MPHTTAPSDDPNYSRDPAWCSICRHKDRGLVETLLASGVFVRDISHEWGFQMDTIRRHNALHSTQQPNVDPVSLLIHLRYLHEEMSMVTHKALYAKGAALDKMKPEHVTMRIAAIKASLAVTQELIKLTDAKKHIDPLVSLPRWTATMSKIARALQDNPRAFETLMRVMKQEGPPGSETYLRGGAKPTPVGRPKRAKVHEPEPTEDEQLAQEEREADEMASEELHSANFPEEEITDGDFPADDRLIDGPTGEPAPADPQDDPVRSDR